MCTAVHLDGDPDAAEEALRGARSWALWQLWDEAGMARLDDEIARLRDHFATHPLGKP